MNLFEYLEYKFRKWRLKRKRQTVIIRGSCKMCGNCCRSICLHAGGKWLKNEKQFLKAVDEDELLSRFEICGKTEEGYLKFSCTSLTDNGTCNDYETALNFAVISQTLQFSCNSENFLPGAGSACPLKQTLKKSCKTPCMMMKRSSLDISPRENRKKDVFPRFPYTKSIAFFLRKGLLYIPTAAL